jgi:hypothetical protein
VWLFEALAENFGVTTDLWRVQAFRAVFGLACLVKFAEAFRHGGWRRFEAGTYPRFQLVRRKGALGEGVARFHKTLLVVRCAPALGIALGVVTKACLLLLIAALALELVYDPRKHPVYFIVNAACLLVAGEPGTLPEFDAGSSSANTWAQWLIMITTFHLYWNSAWLKWRSPQFRSGRTLAQLTHVAAVVADRTRHREYCLPGWAWKPFAGGTPVDVRRWHVIAQLTIALEVLLPVGLVVGRSHLVFFALGLGMHAVFTLLKPRALVPFSMVTVASYLAFVR